MLKVSIEKGFKKDIQRDQKSGNYSQKDFDTLKNLIPKLLFGKSEIDLKHKRHFLRGDMQGIESLHVKCDWLLIFSIEEEVLNLIMLGKHTQIYKKFS